VSSGKLFLLGGDAVLDTVADEFVPAAGGREAVIALLMQGGSDWEKYVPRYAEPWARRGATCYYPIAPDESGELDLEDVSARLQQATGICIGGGHTPTYHRLYATEPLRSLIRERHQAGVPVAGLSAGALIALDVCVFDSDEIERDSPRVVPGLGLAHDLFVEVHFAEWNRLPDLLEAMVQAKMSVGWGIDESACMVVEEGQFRRVLGRSVYKVVMSDFESRAYEMIEHVYEELGT
jgi:cyanophycinase